ncbi:autotransporter domain-containing protein [Gammaproteobacteria bacterium]|nr:autotransporter domain-containing protein [Gammaproteobacteria bacterium]
MKLPKRKKPEIHRARLKPLYAAMLPLMVAGISGLTPSAHVYADQYWDGTDTTSANGVPQGGTATWDAATTNWTDDAAGTTNQAWIPGDTAFFQGTAGTVTINGTQAFNGLDFSVDGYTLNGAGSLAINGAPSTVNVTTGNATINAVIADGAGTALTKTGAGTLTLTGANTYSGGTTISAGTVQVSADNQLGSGTLTMNGGTLRNTGFYGESNAAILSTGTTSTIDNSDHLLYSGVISGDGNLHKTGASILALTGNNTYTGTTTISAGTIQIGSPISNGSIVGDIINNFELIFARSNAYTHVGNVSGTGLIVQGVSGTTTITGALTHTGGTTITDGALQIGNGGTTGSISGDITNDSALIFNRSDAVTFGDVISGTGTVTKQGAGTLTLTGANTYSGGTTISAGIVEVSADDQLGSGTLTMNGGTLRNTSFYTETNAAVLNSGTTSTIDNSNVLFYDAVISGDGNLHKTGADSLILTGNNTYTGVTTISAGILQIGGITTTGSIVGDIINNSQLLFARSNAYTHAGNVSGTGLIEKHVPETLTITGALTHTGGTTISNGALQIGNGGITGSISGDITNNSALIFNRSDAVTFGDVISGTGSFTQAGTGNTNLTGVNTYNGATIVNAGTLSVNGSIANSATTVNSSGTLSGTGTVGVVTLNGGTIAPGNSIGTLSLTGDIDFSSGGVYQVEVDAAGNSDLITATGTATLTNGAVQVQPEAGNYAETTDYTILTAAGGLGGTSFDSVSSSLAFLTPTLSYDGNNVVLSLVRNDLLANSNPSNPGPSNPGPSNVSFQRVAVTANQWTVATALSHLFNTGQTGLDSLFAETFILTEAGAQQAFESLSGVQHTHSQLALQQNTQRFQQVLSRRSQQPTGTLAYGAMPFDANADLLLAFNGDLSLLGASSATSLGNQAMTGAERGWWIQGFGGVGEINDTINASGADFDNTGLALGIDSEWGNAVIGLAGSYTNTDVDAVSSDLDIDSYQLAVYGLWVKESAYLNTLLNYGQHTTDASRDISVGTLFNTANADYDSESLNASIELGKSYGAQSEAEGTTVTPYISLAYQSLQQDRFVESGAGNMNLSVGSEKADGVRTTLGIRLQDKLTTRSGKRLTPFVDIAYVRDDSNLFQLDAGFSAAPNTTFRVAGTELDKSRARIGFGLIGNLSERTIINLGYQGEFAGSDNRHNVAAALRFVW